jgi:branched-chain amino acid aminotransferase
VVLEIARGAGIPAIERNFSLTDVYGADEAFTTGTFAGLAPVGTIDGRVIGTERGPTVKRLQQLYRKRLDEDVTGRRRP